jgi:phosphatidylinositol alpha-mannosyltransferase
MLRAFHRLAPHLPDVSLVVVGEGHDREQLRLLRPEERRRVVMLGAVPNQELAPYHAACDVYVSPATGQESFGYVLVEAMAAGLPVVATDIPGYREVVRDGIEGLLVPPGDPGSLARAIREVLSDPALAARLGAAGRRRAGGYAWSEVLPRIEAIYRRVVGA